MKDVQQLDICIYNYLWHRAKNKFNLRSEYWALIFANEGLTDIESLANHVYSIRQQYAFYRSHGKSPEMNKEVVIDLTAQFWKHLQTYDFQRVFAYCGHWVIAEGRTVENMLDECYEFASKDRPTDFPNLLNIIGEVTNLYNYLYNFGKERWTRRMINAYRNIEAVEEMARSFDRNMNEAAVLSLFMDRVSFREGA
jgi:hypothetical protein